jgi:DNA-binding transcriptional LysR family regulator
LTTFSCFEGLTMPARDILTPQALLLMQTVEREGSLAAAARALDVVPSALTYRVRQLEDELDVLLFDRSSRKASLTAAGRELLIEGERILAELDAVANRVKRVATGWEPRLTIAVDSLISQRVIFELCERFYELDSPTQIKLTAHVMSGTWEALAFGEADLALGGVMDQSASATSGFDSRTIGEVEFAFAVAPHHPLAQASEPLSDELIRHHRAVAVADTAIRKQGITVGLLAGQSVLTVPTMQAKIDAQLRGLGCGFLPVCMVHQYIAVGQLVVRRTVRPPRSAKVTYAWRTAADTRQRQAKEQRNPQGKALSWWLAALEQPTTRQALLDEHKREHKSEHKSERIVSHPKQGKRSG